MSELIENTSQRALPSEPEDPGLVGNSAAIRKLQCDIALVAPTDATIRITGETGTGKGLLARLIHRASAHSEQPFVHICCAALSENGIDSAWVGQGQDALTGASDPASNRFDLPGHGTVFLDEVGELDLTLQRTLLRVLHNREFEPTCGAHASRTTTRVIASTQRDLAAMVRKGSFRSDLYFRLSVFHLRIPPLRERLGDLPILTRVFLGSVAARLGIEAPPIDDAVYRRLAAHAWLGNVRELLNVIECLAIRHQAGTLRAAELDGLLPDEPVAPGLVTGPYRGDLDGSEGPYAIEQVLRETGGNVARSARRLGVPRSTLRYRLRLYGLSHLIPDD